MSATNKSEHTKVLDTFKLDSTGIFLKDLHIERTLNAIKLVHKNLDASSIQKAYDSIEVLRGSYSQRARLVFDTKDLSYDYSLHAIETVPQPVSLEIIHQMRQPSGLGTQNYKWLKRNYWEEILKIKNEQAWDIISLNEFGNCVESSRCNLFFYDAIADLVFTPSLASGCIAGVYRQWVLNVGRIELPGLGLKLVQEAEIHFTKLSRYQLFAANSVRGVLSAGLAT